MKKGLSIFFSMAIMISSRAQVANDNVVLGAGYANQVFYSLVTQTKTSVPVSSWDFALITELMSASIIANPNTIEVYKNPNIDSSGFATVWDTTGYTSWPKLFNSESTWQVGAFNQTANTSDPFDFGWGTYDFSTHAVTGDSCYLIVKGATYIKLWFKGKSQTGVYTIRGSLLDGTGDITFPIDETPYTTKNFVYYSIGAFAPTDPEPPKDEWDLLFTHYYSDIPLAGWYPVVGVYSNFTTKVAKAYPVNTSSVTYTDYVSDFSSNLTEIGYNWKYFDMNNFQYVIEDSLVYFVSVQDSSKIYSLIFTGFDNTSGTIDFTTEILWTAVGIDEVNGILENASVFPNPVHQQINLAYNANQVGQVEASIMNLSGQKVFSQPFNAQRGFNAVKIPIPGLAAGIYVLRLETGGGSLDLKIAITD